MPSSTDITQLLVSWSQGDPDALDRLLPLVYEECRRIAARQLRRERGDPTLNPTALVHELYLRLVDQRRATWQNRAQAPPR
ncbi:MAG: ECF-type sigma factor [Longimicrobiales bacterium]